MRKWTMTAGLLFSAAAAVYSSQAIGANPAKSSKSAGGAAPTDVKVLEESVDPFAATAAPQTPSAPALRSPTTGPAAGPSNSPSTSEGSNPGVQTVAQSEHDQPASQTTLETSTSQVPPAQMNLNSDGTFSLNIVGGADIVEQLRVIGFQAQMSIIPSKEVHGSLPAIDLYNVTVTEALDALLHANGYAWRQKGNFIYVYSAKEIQEMEKANRVQNTEVIRLFYTPAANAANMIKPVLSGDAQVSLTTPAISGIESGAQDVGGNSHATDDMLVVTDYPENLDRVRAVIREIDQRPQQILIEATILRAALSDDNALGVDFNVVGGVDFTTFTSNSGQITDADIGDAFDNNANSVGTGNNFTSGVGNGFRVGVVTNNVSVFLAALEGVTNTAILANPKVLALNKQKGEVIVGRKDGYLTTTVTESTATQTVEFLDTGTRLIFRPYIGNDGYIRMEIHPEDSSGGLTSDNLPFKVTTEVTSNVMVKDGHTIVIGGLFRESSDSSRNQVPFLGNLPVAGYLFRNQRDRTVREEVIILLTPHIVKDDDAYSALSREQLQNAEKIRVGVRRGMMPFGRERMAEIYYQCALKELDKSEPDRKKALFYLDCATGLSTGFIEAINLKQELTGREVTLSEGSSIRSFVKQSIMVDLPPATTQPSAEAPSTQPLAKGEQSPSTQPLVKSEQSPSTQPLVEVPLSDSSQADSDQPFSFDPQPMDELSLNELSQQRNEDADDLIKQTNGVTVVTPIEEEDEFSPSTQPVVELLTPTTQPLAAGSKPTTQPSNGIFGLHNALGQMLKKNEKTNGDENASPTTVTELPTEELPTGSTGDNK